MGPTFTHLGLVLVLCSSILGASLANRGWQYGFNNGDWSPKHGIHRPNQADSPNKIIVGGSNHWTFGFNYSDWAIKNAPFYLNDTLVFKYDPPSENNTRPHNIYLLPDKSSLLNCNLTKAVKIANESQGAGEGFEFVLKKRHPYYFACGASNGIHCNVGQMKFSVLPELRH